MMVSMPRKLSPGFSVYSFMIVVGMLLSRDDGGIDSDVEKPLIAMYGSIGSKRSSGPTVWMIAGPPALPLLRTLMLVGLSVDEMLMSGVIARKASRPGGYGADHGSGPALRC